MAEGAAFKRRQLEFAAHIRDPDRHAAPADVEERRMAIYRELLYNNVEDFMGNAFPVLRAITADDAWNEMIRDYFARHQSRTPLFPRMPAEFLDYLQSERRASDRDPPFLLELAHYEWMELALAQADEVIDAAGPDPDGELLDIPLALSPLAVALSYSFPVHRVGPDYQPVEPGPEPTCLVVYRDSTDQVGFMELNPPSYRLLQIMDASEPVTARGALERLVTELQHPEPASVIAGGVTILKEFIRRQIVVYARTA